MQVCSMERKGQKGALEHMEPTQAVVSFAGFRGRHRSLTFCSCLLTDDHSRILLKSQNSHSNSDYINASPIVSPRSLGRGDTAVPRHTCDVTLPQWHNCRHGMDALVSSLRRGCTGFPLWSWVAGIGSQKAVQNHRPYPEASWSKQGVLRQM